MQPISNDRFGPLVAYLVSGETVLVGLRLWVPIVDQWFLLATTDAPTIGGFLFRTVAALAAGMTVNAVRWALIDTRRTWTGLRTPPLDFSRHKDRVAASQFLIEIL